MYKKNLLFVKDNLKDFISLMEEIKTAAPFNVEIISLHNLLSDQLREKLLSLDPADLFVVFEASLMQDQKKEITEYFRTLFKHLFTNILLIVTSPELLKDEDIILGKKHCYYFGENTSSQGICNNFILYTIKLFNECILSNRLVDYITHSFNQIVNSELLLKKKEEIELLNKELEKRNKTDSLTNLYNRQAIFEFLEKEAKRSMRDLWRISNFLKEEADARLLDYDQKFANEPVGELLDHVGVFSVMMVDVDHFKKINDTYGHLCGDEVLKTIGLILQDKTIFRESDILGRFGGEEFIGIFPSTNVTNALGPAMRFVKALKEKSFFPKDAPPFKVTVSIGISEYHVTDKSKEDVIHRADKALYWAKEHGRDQIAIYEKIF